MGDREIPGEESSLSTRKRILDAALALTRSDGPEAATTRAVAAAASVQVPTIYRLFGDKQGLLNAAVEHAIATYVAGKSARALNPDPIQALRDSWDNHVQFGLENPRLFSIMSLNPQSPAAAEGLRAFSQLIRAVAKAGKLRTSEEQAVAMARAACVGLVTTLIADENPDPDNISAATREAILAAVTNETGISQSITQQTAASTLRATLDEDDTLTKGERALLDELLERLSKKRP